VRRIVDRMEEDAVTFAKLAPSSARFQRLRAELGLSSWGMNLVSLQQGQRGRIHAHEHQEEVYLVLEGQLALTIEGEHHLLGKWDLVRLAPHVRRQLANISPEPAVVLALGGTGLHSESGRDGKAWASWDDHTPEGHPIAEIPLPDDLPVG
jgi:quercetin dioxygenase-like cupin family protein